MVDEKGARRRCKKVGFNDRAAVKWGWVWVPPPGLGEVGGEVNVGGLMKDGIVGSEPKCWLGKGIGVEE